MTAVIAERKIDAISPDGRTGSITIQIGRPECDPNPGGDWYCPIYIRGMGRDGVRSFFGVDSLQALQFALGILDLEVRRFAGTYRLSWIECANLGLKPWSPTRIPKRSPTRGRAVRHRRP